MKSPKPKPTRPRSTSDGASFQLGDGDTVDLAMRKVAQPVRERTRATRKLAKVQDYHPGDVIEVADAFGMGPGYRARVKTHEKNVRNGRPGGTGSSLGGPLPRGSKKWWYDEQVIRVVGKGAPREITLHLENMIYPADGSWSHVQAFASPGPGGRPMVTLRVDLGRKTLTVDLSEVEVQGLETAFRRWREG